MKKLEFYPQITVYKFKPEDYRRELPFAQDPSFRYHISFFSKKEWYLKKKNTYVLSDLKKFFPTRNIICVLYEDNDVNIVMEGKK